MLKLIIADFNPDLLSAWSEVFHKISEIVFIDADFQTVANFPELNAVLTKAIFANDRYGGRPKIGESQILSSHGEKGMPPWIVTTPLLRSDIKYAPGEYEYKQFVSAFEKIEQFNITDKEPKIRTLGFEIDSLYGSGKKTFTLYKEEAKALRKAYLEYWNK